MISKNLIAEYGEQVVRDDRYNKNGLELNAESNAMVAQACGQIGSSKRSFESFRSKILVYAKSFQPPCGWF